MASGGFRVELWRGLYPVLWWSGASFGCEDEGGDAGEGERPRTRIRVTLAQGVGSEDAELHGQRRVSGGALAWVVNAVWTEPLRRR
jgi:hypothetical protein